MRTFFWFSILIAFISASSCNEPKTGNFNSEKEWNLGWQVWQSEALQQDYAKGAAKFDSLIKDVKNPPLTIMTSGIRCLAETYQFTKAYEVLVNYDKLDKLDLCNTNWFYPPNTQQWKDICNQMAPPEKILYPQVKDDLLVMYINDQYARGRELQVLTRETGYRVRNEEIYDEDVQGVDRINTEKLKIIIEELGFPDATMVGKTGMKSIYTLIRNANHDVVFQESQLSNVLESARNGDIELEDYAFLHDQVEIAKGNPPVFGTHFSSDDYAEHRAVLSPPMDEKLADQKRREFGFMPLELVKKLLLHSFDHSGEETKS